MTVDEFLKKYNKCLFCRSYKIQGNACYGCKWRFAHGQYAKDSDFDLFEPTDEWARRMNQEVNADDVRRSHKAL